MNRPGIEPMSPGLLANTLTTRPMNLVGRGFANGPGDLGSILGRVNSAFNEPKRVDTP